MLSGLIMMKMMMIMPAGVRLQLVVAMKSVQEADGFLRFLLCFMLEEKYYKRNIMLGRMLHETNIR